jgi:DNA anti-recombination protein RmuC
VTQPSGSGPGDLDTIRQLLFGAEVARVERDMAADRRAAQEQVADLERRLGQRLEELAQRVTAQLDDLSRRQQAHADRVTQLLDQVMAELTRRVDGLLAETRARVDELKVKAAELERAKLSVADFGASLAALGQKFSGGPGPQPPASG